MCPILGHDLKVFTNLFWFNHFPCQVIMSVYYIKKLSYLTAVTKRDNFTGTDNGKKDEKKSLNTY